MLCFKRLFQSAHGALIALAIISLVGSFRATPALAQASKESENELSLAIVQAVCPKQVRTAPLKNGTDYGCGVCPSFMSAAGDAPSNSQELVFEIRKVLKGSFTRAGAKEVLAEFFGCEPHANNFGGTMVLDRSRAKLRLLEWFPGIIGLVRTYPGKDGRDLVLSQGGHTGQGESTDWVTVYDFTKPDSAQQTLLAVEDDTGAFCMLEQINIGSISGLEFPDLNNDGHPDLRVKVKAGKAKVPLKYRGHCDRDFKAPDVPTYTIDFVFDGKTFHVTPSTAAALRRVNSQQQ